MEKYFTLISKVSLKTTLFFVVSILMTLVANAQSCPNETILWFENFGAGTTVTSNPDILTSGLRYEPTGAFESEGIYRVANNTGQKPEWHASTDHTGNADGKMLVINGQAETFYRHTVTSNGFAPGTYNINLYLMNVDTLGVCGTDPLLPAITFSVEYLSVSNTWVALSGSPFAASPVSQSATPAWVSLGSSFILPLTGSFMPVSMRITLSDGTVGGCGNDFAIDDIKFSLCPEGGLTPVQFLNLTAQQSGNNVLLNWSTAQELNNSYFEVQRSADGNTNWNTVATVKGAGNSQVLRDYKTIDVKPLSGMNYYRVKQVDIDGKYEFSKTVNVRMNIATTAVSVLANPFRNTLSVNFNSSSSQIVLARLIDITGKQVAQENWSVAAGTIRKDFSNVTTLQPGMYILSIRNNSGELLFNAKVIKQ